MVIVQEECGRYFGAIAPGAKAFTNVLTTVSET
jgi:hypothetical protein